MEEGRAIVALPEGVALPEVLGGWRSLRQLAKFWHVQANLEVFQHHFLSIRCISKSVSFQVFKDLPQVCSPSMRIFCLGFLIRCVVLDGF